MPQTIKAIVRYDGTDFAGWQVQPGQTTVQGRIEEALSTIAQAPVRIIGAGRTDAGVHALGQAFSCQWPGELDANKLRRSLSQMLGTGIRIESIEAVGDGFHALRSAKAKRYAYTIDTSSEPDPLSARYAWTVGPNIDLDVLARLCRLVEGERDFGGFRCEGTEVKTTVRTIFSAVFECGPVIGPMDSANTAGHLTFHGSGFLYKMVRNITGTIVDIAAGRLDEEVLQQRLREAGPYKGYTAPAQGLCLIEVEY
jgi:tRNA pseudouridine38-40 synthase